MNRLPVFANDDKDFQLMQSRWTSILDPVITNPSNNVIILKNVALISGTNIINTLINRKLQGWRIIRQRAAANIYDNQDNNQTPQLTLLLISDANVVVDLEIF